MQKNGKDQWDEIARVKNSSNLTLMHTKNIFCNKC